MIVWLRKVFRKHFMELAWQGVLAALVSYIAFSWVFLYLCGENALTARVDFPYWLVVTASTVGYGDLSPTTDAGKLVTAFFVIPFGLSIFALTIGRLAAFASFYWRRGVRGLSDLNVENHILVVGWMQKRTHHLLQLLLKDQASCEQPRRIVLCTVKEMDNPLPDQIDFVSVSAFTDDAEMERACVDKAYSIIIDNESDDITMTSALYCHSRNPDAHLLAYFKDESLSRLLKVHCPNVECMPSVAVEMLAKSAMDPGSSRLHHELLNVETGMTQYSVIYPDTMQPAKISPIFHSLKEKHQATLIGIACAGNEKIELNPKLDKVVEPGSTIYYIAENRITDMAWEALNV